MEITLLYLAVFIVLMIAILSVINLVINRVATPTNTLKEEIASLEKRIDKK